jgi:ATP-binding cassette subfamily C (CFTR/MRP) protein 1
VQTKRSAGYQTPMSIASAVLSLSAAACIFGHLWAQHRHSLRTSSILSIYLSVTILLDAAVIRSLTRRNGFHIDASLLIAATVLKGCLLLLEEVSKRTLSYQKTDSTAPSRESFSGFWNRRLFVWVNWTLFKGFKSLLVVETLQNIGSDFDSETLLRRFQKQWEPSECCRNSLLATFQLQY